MGLLGKIGAGVKKAGTGALNRAKTNIKDVTSGARMKRNLGMKPPPSLGMKPSVTKSMSKSMSSSSDSDSGYD